jgi:hypothetical protein
VKALVADDNPMFRTLLELNEGASTIGRGMRIILNLFLGRLANETGRRRFSAQQSRKRVTTQ